MTYDIRRPRSFFPTNERPTPTHLPSTQDTVLPPTDLMPCYPNGPLNLNPDGTPINFRKSHAGPNMDYWLRADAEEFERLFNTSTMQPILYADIPPGNVVTYVNPVCVEKVNDDGSMKFRTRLTKLGEIAYRSLSINRPKRPTLKQSKFCSTSWSLRTLAGLPWTCLTSI